MTVLYLPTTHHKALGWTALFFFLFPLTVFNFKTWLFFSIHVLALRYTDRINSKL